MDRTDRIHHRIILIGRVNLPLSHNWQFAPLNRSTPQLHIPSASDRTGRTLVSLNTLGLPLQNWQLKINTTTFFFFIRVSWPEHQVSVVDVIEPIRSPNRGKGCVLHSFRQLVFSVRRLRINGDDRSWRSLQVRIRLTFVFTRQWAELWDWHLSLNVCHDGASSHREGHSTSCAD